ncbi:unnamed protein product [Taenia asiatica]|uniref:Uncharacterized protein n=1 Tax=Taenia asiatica TaxID=60517 RepID=A0A0R3W0R7_TAEAS|nr:unnamed protein product [Taenia asiatica]
MKWDINAVNVMECCCSFQEDQSSFQINLSVLRMALDNKFLVGDFFNKIQDKFCIPFNQTQCQLEVYSYPYQVYWYNRSSTQLHQLCGRECFKDGNIVLPADYGTTDDDLPGVYFALNRIPQNFTSMEYISFPSAASYFRFILLLLLLILYQTSTKLINLFGSTNVAFLANGQAPSTNGTAATTMFAINHGAGINHASESHRKICITEKEADGGALT